MSQSAPTLFERKIVASALWSTWVKLDPRLMIRNSRMFFTWIGALLTAIGIFSAKAPAFVAKLAVGLWFTVLFANFAEAVAEG